MRTLFFAMEKNVKKKGRLKMALFTFSGGVHPADGKNLQRIHQSPNTCQKEMLFYL